LRSLTPYGAAMVAGGSPILGERSFSANTARYVGDEEFCFSDAAGHSSVVPRLDLIRSGPSALTLQARVTYSVKPIGDFSAGVYVVRALSGEPMLARSEAVILSTDWEWRHTFAHMLDAYGLDYAFASSIEECKEIVHRDHAELIFWDSRLEPGSHHELLRLIRPPADHVKVVVVSHVDDWERPMSGARKDAFAVIPFPGQPTDIEWVLSRANRAAFLEAHPHQAGVFPTHA